MKKVLLTLLLLIGSSNSFHVYGQHDRDELKKYIRASYTKFEYEIPAKSEWGVISSLSGENLLERSFEIVSRIPNRWCLVSSPRSNSTCRTSVTRFVRAIRSWCRFRVPGFLSWTETLSCSSTSLGLSRRIFRKLRSASVAPAMHLQA